MILNFPAIEAMQEASEAAGWQCEYRQLDAGRLEARTVLRESGEVSVLRESASRKLSIVAESPADTVTIIVPASDSCFRINSIDVVDHTAVVVPASTDFFALSDRGADAMSMHIPAARFRAWSDAAFGGPAPALSSGVHAFEVNTESLQSLRRIIRAGTNDESDSPGPFGSRSDFEHVIVKLLGNIRNNGRNKTSLREARARRVTTKAIRHIDRNLSANLSVVDLCCVAGVSLSTLERVFRHELQMTPLAYIKALRLDAVRRSLIKGDPDIPIAQLAHDQGISHMARFSGDYRRQFGRLPSEERRH
jgi:AraC family ethanolamine operon transcriptional activator